MLEHGGGLCAAAQEHGIAIENWLDLSTGVSPHSWPIPALPSHLWTRLPEEEDSLIESACRYYGATSILPVAGSQAAIQALPRLRAPCRVGIPHPAYAEHAYAWKRAGHHVVSWHREQGTEDLDVLVLINPNNPTGELFSRDELLQLHAGLANKDGWLVVDEAFIDTLPQQSLAADSHQAGMIILRSLGKFFGLPGARVGFAMAAPCLLQTLREVLGPWPVASPARWLARQALDDTAWQLAQRNRLVASGRRLLALLRKHNLVPDGGTTLFQWLKTSKAAMIHRQLAQQGILTRLYTAPQSLRFGLPGTDAEWQRLAEGLARVVV